MKIVSKAQLMHAVVHQGQRECFEHSELGIFDVTGMRERAASIGVLHNVSIDQIVPFVMQNRVTDPTRVMQLSEQSWLYDPGIMIVSGYDEAGVPTATMIDGHHRSLRRAIEGRDDMSIWFIPAEKAIRPAPGWVKNPFVDWGDEIRDGVIIRSTRAD